MVCNEKTSRWDTILRHLMSDKHFLLGCRDFEKYRPRRVWLNIFYILFRINYSAQNITNTPKHELVYL
jgi:hypothetical protein